MAALFRSHLNLVKCHGYENWNFEFAEQALDPSNKRKGDGHRSDNLTPLVHSNEGSTENTNPISNKDSSDLLPDKSNVVSAISSSPCVISTQLPTSSGYENVQIRTSITTSSKMNSNSTQNDFLKNMNANNNVLVSTTDSDSQVGQENAVCSVTVAQSLVSKGQNEPVTNNVLDPIKSGVKPFPKPQKRNKFKQKTRDECDNVIMFSETKNKDVKKTEGSGSYVDGSDSSMGHLPVSGALVTNSRKLDTEKLQETSLFRNKHEIDFNETDIAQHGTAKSMISFFETCTPPDRENPESRKGIQESSTGTRSKADVIRQLDTLISSPRQSPLQSPGFQGQEPASLWSGPSPTQTNINDAKTNKRNLKDYNTPTSPLSPTRPKPTVPAKPSPFVIRRSLHAASITSETELKSTESFDGGCNRTQTVEAVPSDGKNDKFATTLPPLSEFSIKRNAIDDTDTQHVSLVQQTHNKNQGVLDHETVWRNSGASADRIELDSVVVEKNSGVEDDQGEPDYAVVRKKLGARNDKREPDFTVVPEHSGVQVGRTKPNYAVVQKKSGFQNGRKKPNYAVVQKNSGVHLPEPASMPQRERRQIHGGLNIMKTSHDLEDNSDLYKRIWDSSSVETQKQTALLLTTYPKGDPATNKIVEKHNKVMLNYANI